VNAYAAAGRAYTESSVLTAPPERLVVMLYDGAVRYVAQAATALRTGDRERARDRMRRAEAVIDELNVTLDMSAGDIAQRLRSIYMFIKTQIHEATLRADPAPLDASARLLRDLREAWEHIADQSEASRT
jgi:flagellar secretion chaperone FliS